MPFYQDDALPGPRRPMAPPPAATPPENTGPPSVIARALSRTPQLSFLEPLNGPLLGAAERQENTLVSSYNYVAERTGFTPDPGHNPIDVIGGTDYEARYLDRFVDSRSEAETRARMSRIDREEHDRAMLERAGSAGLAAQVAMGALDPTLFIPVGTIYRGVKTGSAALKSALMTGAATGAMVAGQEAILYGTQELRTGAESTANIASATILGGILGGAISTLSSRELAKLTDVMDGYRGDVNADLGAGAPAAGGAAPSAQKPLTLAPALGTERLASGMSPVTRLQTSPFDTAKATIRDMADAGLTYRENFEGVPTSVGGTVETRAKMRRGPMSEAISRMDDAYARYYFDKTDPSFIERKTAAMRAFWARTSADDGGKMSSREFRTEVGKAMRRNDEHPNPFVAEIAKTYRELVFEPLKKEAVKLKVPGFTEDMGVVGADSYLTRVYLREKITAKRDQFRNILLDHATQKRQSDIASFETSNAQRIAGLEAKAAELDAKINEVPVAVAKDDRLKAFDETHAADLAALRQPLDAELDLLAHARDRELEQAKSIYKQQVAKAKKSEKAALKAKLGEAEAKISLAHEQAVKKAERQHAPMLRQFTKASIGERTRLARSLDAHNRLLVERANLRDRIDNLKLKRSDAEATLPEELPGMVDEVINTIQGEGALRLPGLTLMAGPRGPLAARVLRIPDAAIEEFLESDIEKIARVYTTSMAGDLELMGKFGSATMKEQFQKLTEEFNAKVAKIDNLDIAPVLKEKRRSKLQKRFNNDMRDLQALRDRVRGNYAVPENPDGLLYRAGRLALNANYLARGGGFTIASLSDIGRPIMRYGLVSTLRDGWVPLVTNFSAFKLAARELRLWGTALDLVRDQRALELADLLDDYGRNTKFERGTQFVADRFSAINLMKYWNGSMKTLTGVVSLANATRAVKAVAIGAATRKQISTLAAGGIDEAMAKRIWKEAETTGTEVNGTFLPNTEGWGDRGAAEALGALLNREVEMAIVTPGLEKPLFMSKGWGKVAGQFKSFTFASTNKVLLAGLQQRDAAALQGVIVMLAFGALMAQIKSQLAGRDTSSWTPEKWAVEAADQSGIFGVLTEANALAEKATRGRVGLSVLTGEPVSRYASRNIGGALLGPTFDALSDATALGGIGSDDWSAADTRALRKIVPFQNLFYVRQLFDRLENNVNEHFNIPPRRPRR